MSLPEKNSPLADKALLMRTHNLCFGGETRKIVPDYPSYQVLCSETIFTMACHSDDLINFPL